MSSIKFSKYLFVFIFTFLTGFAHSNERIVYLDIDYLMNNSLAGKSLKIQINKINKSNFEKFTKTEKNLQTKEKKIISQKNVLSEEEFKKNIKEFKIEIDNFNSIKLKAVNELGEKKYNAQKELTQNVTAIITDYSSKNSIDYILNKQSIVIGKSELDITSIILEILDSKVKNIKIK